MTSLNHLPPDQPQRSNPRASSFASLRPDLAAYYALGSRKYAHAGQHREFGVLAELRAHFGHD